MVPCSSFKTQVVLSDYFYQKDIKYRMLISKLSVIEVTIFSEILHHSLKIPLSLLAMDLDMEQEELRHHLTALTHLDLFKIEKDSLTVDKEMRKYYELHMEKFQTDFRPTLEFLQNLLSLIPLDVLLKWYTIPRTSNNIFASIVQECFRTPKVYRHYLQELKLEDPVAEAIVKDLYSSCDYLLLSKEMISKYSLSCEEFERILLLLEYHFVCCVSYKIVDGEWQQVISPFAEWRKYLQTEKKLRPKVLPSSQISAVGQNEFSYIEELTTYLLTLQKKEETTNLPINYLNCPKKLESKLFQLQFIEKKSTGVFLTPKGLLWAKKKPWERAVSLAVDADNYLPEFKNSALWTLKTIHAVEKSLRSLKPFDWIDLKEFISSLTISIGESKSTTLQKQGKRWVYLLPKYSDLEVELISKLIMERCYELGITAIGHYQGAPCFCLTSLGSQFIY